MYHLLLSFGGIGYLGIYPTPGYPNPMDTPRYPIPRYPTTEYPIPQILYPRYTTPSTASTMGPVIPYRRLWKHYLLATSLAGVNNSFYCFYFSFSLSMGRNTKFEVLAYILNSATGQHNLINSHTLACNSINKLFKIITASFVLHLLNTSDNPKSVFFLNGTVHYR